MDTPTDEQADDWAAEIAAALAAALAAAYELLQADPTGDPVRVLSTSVWRDLVDEHVTDSIPGLIDQVRDWLRGQLDDRALLARDDWYDGLTAEILDDAYGLDEQVQLAAGRAQRDGRLSLFEEAAESLAANVAADQVTTAVGSAVVEAADESADDLEVIWNNRRDDRVRTSHDIDGQVRANDGTFTLNTDGEAVTCTRPRDPALAAQHRLNCRCWVVLRERSAGLSARPARRANTISTAALAASTESGGSQMDISTRFAGVVCAEGLLTSDDRYIELGALTTRDMPGLPFFYMDEQTEWGHLGSRLAGSFDHFGRVPMGGHNLIDGEGNFDTGGEIGAQAARQYGAGHVRGVSVDLDMVDYEMRIGGPDGKTITDMWDYYDARMAGERIILVFTEARIMGATGTATPAFDETRLEVVSASRALTAAWGKEPQGRAVYRLHMPFAGGWDASGSPQTAAALVASARERGGPADYFSVPRQQFTDWYGAAPEPDAAFPFSWYPSGQVDGYVARWGVRHPATGEVARPSGCGYLDALDGTAMTADGQVRGVRVHFGVPGDHPDPHADWQEARRQYNLAPTGAIVRPYEDSIGLRVRGGALYGITNAQWHQLAANGVSGDWRYGTPNAKPGNRELIAISSTADPAFKTGTETTEQAQARYANAGHALVASAGGAESAGLGLGTFTPGERDAARLEALEREVNGLRDLFGAQAFAKVSEQLERFSRQREIFAVPAKYRT